MAARSRRGFTLVELMVVIVIIGMLVGLLLPAIRGAFTTARVGHVRSEISNLETALAQFKSQYGIYPPSRITLYEEAGTWDTRSRGLIRRMWPQFNFNVNRDFNLDGEAKPDPDGDGANGVTLNGAECLVLFLGGVVDLRRDPSTGNVVGSGALIGFSKNPNNPLSPLGENREGPFYEFDGGIDPSSLQAIGRMSNVNRNVNRNNGNFFPEYKDPLPSQRAPYVYFSSYEGRGYEEQDAALVGMHEHYHMAGEDQNLNLILDDGEDRNGNNQLDPGPHYKAQSFQLISPGYDGRYGAGGTYSPDQASNLNGRDVNGNETIDTGPNANPDEAALAHAERDNITNFHSTELDP